MIYAPNRSTERHISSCMHGCNPSSFASMKRKRSPNSSTPTDPTHTHGTRDLTQQHKQAHDQDLDSRPAFEFALLKEHEQNAAQEQPACHAFHCQHPSEQTAKQSIFCMQGTGAKWSIQGSINRALLGAALAQAKRAELNSLRLLCSWHLLSSCYIYIYIYI